MKKTLAILLALVLALSTASFAMADEEVISYEFLTRFFSEGEGNMNYNEGNPVTEYLEEKTGIHIHFTNLPATDADTKLNTIIASGDYPDVLFMRPVENSTLLEWADEGIIYPLEDLIAEYMPNYSAILAEREDIRNAVTAPDGHIYSFARTDGGIHILVNNKIYVYGPWYQMYLDAGNAEVETTEDYRNMLQYFKDNDMNGNGDPNDEIPVSGSSALIQNLINPFTLMGSYNDMYLDEEGNVTVPYDKEGYREGLAYANSLWEAGLIDTELFTQDTTQVSAMVNRENETDRIIGGFSSLWDGTYINATIVPYDTYIAIGPLTGPDGTKQATYSKSDVGTGYFTIFNTCEHVPELLEWLDYLYSYEGTMLMAYGLEGISWVWSDTPSISGEEKSVERTMTGSALYAQNLQWLPNAPCYRTPEIKYIESGVAGGSGIDLYVSSMRYLPYANEDAAISYNLWMDEDQNEEFTLFKSEIGSYVAEQQAAFVTGKLSTEGIEWDNYMNTLQKMGLEDYIALMQEIVDANTH